MTVECLARVGVDGVGALLPSALDGGDGDRVAARGHAVEERRDGDCEGDGEEGQATTW